MGERFLEGHLQRQHARVGHGEELRDLVGHRIQGQGDSSAETSIRRGALNAF
jgi:hypothetical protein